MLDQADDPSGNFAAKLTWLVHKETVTVAELLSASRLCEDELNDLIGYGALPAVSQDRQEQVFSAKLIVPLCKAVQLKQDYDLDTFSVALVLGLLQKIEFLQEQLCALESRQGLSS
jgi:chaperone modulatory protein CbpM